LVYFGTESCPAQTKRRNLSGKKHSAWSQSSIINGQKEVLHTDGLLLAAIWDADDAARQKLADDKLLYTSYSGETLNKEKWIKSVEKIVPGVASYQTKNTKVLLQGEMAIVTGDLNVQFREEYDNGEYREGNGWQRYIHVYQKKNNQWLLVLGQMTPIAKYLWKFRV
jgi:hypothetical protein